MEKKWFRGLVLDFVKSQFLAIMLTVLSLPMLMLIKANTFKIYYSIFCYILLLVLTYSASWQAGWADPNRVKLGQIEYSPYKALKAAFFLSGIWVFLALINLIFDNSIIKWIISGFNFYMIGIYSYCHYTKISMFFITLVSNLIWPLIAHIAYTLGYKRISLGFKIMYKNPEENKKKKRRY